MLGMIRVKDSAKLKQFRVSELSKYLMNLKRHGLDNMSKNFKSTTNDKMKVIARHSRFLQMNSESPDALML